MRLQLSVKLTHRCMEDMPNLNLHCNKRGAWLEFQEQHLSHISKISAKYITVGKMIQFHQVNEIQAYSISTYKILLSKNG